MKNCNKKHISPAPKGARLIFQLKEYAVCLLFDFSACDKRNTGCIALLCSDDHLRRPDLNFPVPGIYRVVILFPCGGDFLLQIRILLDSVRNSAVRLQVGIIFESLVDSPAYRVALVALISLPSLERTFPKERASAIAVNVSLSSLTALSTSCARLESITTLCSR